MATVHADNRRLILIAAVGAAALAFAVPAARAHDGHATPGHFHVAHAGPDHFHVAQASQPASAPTSAPTSRHTGKHHAKCPYKKLTSAVAVLQPTEGNQAQGTVRFTATPDGVNVVAHVTGLAPNTVHGFHIHQYGDCSMSNGKSAGGHYNPSGHDHALPGTSPRHAGDMGNLTSDANGTAHLEATFDQLSIACPHMKNPIVGRGVIVHALPDTGAQPTGAAGARIACGTIGIAKSE